MSKQQHVVALEGEIQELFDLLVRSRAALAVCDDAIKRNPTITIFNLDILLADLASSIDKRLLKVE